MMQTLPEISIIIPVYKVEKYLQPCLESISSQTFTGWECILVDDGSPDNSGAICEEYAARDSRFKVIHRKNGGVSAARNDGLEVSRGKYISFIDPDDIAHPLMMERLKELIESHDADVAQVGFELWFKSFRRKKALVDSVVELERGKVAQELLYGRRLPCYVWNKLFRREVIDTHFPEGMVFEDMYVMSQWVSNIRKMVISPEILYSYRQRCGSIVNSNYAENRLEYLKSVFRLAYSLRTLEPMYVSEDVVYKCIWKGVICAGKNIARYVDEAVIRVDAIGKVSRLSRNIYIPPAKKIGLKTWWRIHLLHSNPKAFARMMRFVYFFSSHKYKRINNQFD